MRGRKLKWNRESFWTFFSYSTISNRALAYISAFLTFDLRFPLKFNELFPSPILGGNIFFHISLLLIFNRDFGVVCWGESYIGSTELKPMEKHFFKLHQQERKLCKKFQFSIASLWSFSALEIAPSRDTSDGNEWKVQIILSWTFPVPWHGKNINIIRLLKGI